MMWLLFSSLLWAQSPATDFKFEFGSHSLEQIRIYQSAVEGQQIWLLEYSLGEGGKVLAQRGLSEDIAQALQQQINEIAKQKQRELAPTPIACVSKMQITAFGNLQKYCLDDSTLDTKKKISSWIKDIQGYLNLKTF